MWILEHVAIGYVLWSGWVRFRDGRPPTGSEFWVVLFAAVLPDLIDKPLAWTFEVLPAGRSLAHSLLTAAVLVAISRRIAARRGRETLATAFGLGYVSHLLADAVFPLLSGEYGELTYLLWPILPAPYDDTSKALLSELLLRIPMAIRGPHLLVAALTLLLWASDGMPGVPRRWANWRPVRQDR